MHAYSLRVKSHYMSPIIPNWFHIIVIHLVVREGWGGGGGGGEGEKGSPGTKKEKIRGERDSEMGEM